ncbi:MAG: hypothetical protein JRI95_10420 [Deltaproteobacteria bacterium]|nr:hypothetical protein [Deltaproteobacteria bacterium]MBW2085915.1 hypothetical protein [Deltaproteobacteria bacterium]
MRKVNDSMVQVCGRVVLAVFFMTAAALVFSPVKSARAADLFTLTVTSEGEVYTQGFSSVADMIDNFDGNAIVAHIPAYTDNSAVDATLFYRGLPFTATMGASGAAIHLVCDAIGVDVLFSGATRDESLDLLEDWFKGEGQEALTKMARYLAQNTPTDPIAGNPTSLMGNLVKNDFNVGFMDRATEIAPEVVAPPRPAPGERQVNANLIALKANIGTVQMGDFKGSYYKLPLSYTFRSNQDPRRQLKISLPLAMLETAGARTYNAGFGIAVSLPVNKLWVLTPAANYSLVGSVDMGSAAQMISASLTSALSLESGKFTFNIGNMVGYYQTLKFQYSGYAFDPKINNTVLRNGLMISTPISRRFVIEIFVTDTRYFGTDLFIDQYNEGGFAFGYAKAFSKKKQGKVVNYLRSLRIGATYIFAKDYNAWQANFGFVF